MLSISKAAATYIFLSIVQSFFISSATFADANNIIDHRELSFNEDFYELPILNFDHFEGSNSECTPTAGELIMTPNAIRLLSFYNDQISRPMTVTAEKTRHGDSFVWQNQGCRITLVFSRRDGPDGDPSVIPDRVKLDVRGSGEQPSTSKTTVLKTTTHLLKAGLISKASQGQSPSVQTQTTLVGMEIATGMEAAMVAEGMAGVGTPADMEEATARPVGMAADTSQLHKTLLTRNLPILLSNLMQHRKLSRLGLISTLQITRSAMRISEPSPMEATSQELRIVSLQTVPSWHLTEQNGSHSADEHK